MKKLLFILSIALISLGACKKKAEDVPAVPGCMDVNSLTFNAEATEDDGSCEYIEKVNRAAYIHFTEDWCGPCGAYGGPTFDSCVTKYEGTTLTCMKVYGSSNVTAINNPFASVMKNASNFNITSIPTRYVNAEKKGVSSDINSNVSWVRTQANSFAAQPVVAGVHITKGIEGTNMNVTADIEFYSAIAAGKDYRLAIYVLEDNIISKQTVDGVATPVMNYVHRNVWRGTNGLDYKGVKLNSNAAIAANMRYTISSSIALKSTWNNSNLKVMAIIWEVPTTGFPKVVNSNVRK